MEKRAQGLSTNAIVLIILAVVILVILVLGFTIGWNKFAPFIGGDNVETVVNQCSIACLNSQSYDFCEKKRVLKAEDLPEGVNEVEGTCEFFSTEEGYEKYGIAECEGLC